MRTIVDIDEKQVTILDEFSKSSHLSRAAVIREAITLFIEKRIKPTKHSAFGIWKDRNIDALNYQDKLRNEWTDK